MRILIVSQYFWPENFRINDFATGLKERGHEVTILTGKPNYPEGQFFERYGFLKCPKETFNDMEIIRVPVIPRFSGKNRYLIINYISFVFFACLIGPFRCRKKYDLIFVYLTSPITAALPAILFKKIKKARLYLWIQDLWPESVSATGAVHSQRILGWIGKLVGWIYNKADHILVSSRSFIDSIGKRVKNKNIEINYFPNSVEALYQPLSPHPDFKIKYQLPTGFLVMFAGNIGYAQDFPMILKAAEKLRHKKDIHFVILGTGRHFPWVNEQVKERKLSNVHLLGSYPADLMPHFFAEANVLLVSLKNDPVFSLTVPCKIQSYLACRKPIIAALEGQGAYIINEANAGISVPSGNSELLALAIEKMSLCGEEELKKMASKGFDYYLKHFQRENLLATFESWINKNINHMACDKI